MEQMTLFDIIEPEDIDTDIENMTTAAAARIIGEALGVSFKPTDYETEHEARPSKKLKLTVHMCRYSCNPYDDTAEGKAFIGVGFSYGTSGGGAPCDGIESAIAYFRKIMKRVENGEY